MLCVGGVGGQGAGGRLGSGAVGGGGGADHVGGFCEVCHHEFDAQVLGAHVSLQGEAMLHDRAVNATKVTPKAIGKKMLSERKFATCSGWRHGSL